MERISIGNVDVEVARESITNIRESLNSLSALEDNRRWRWSYLRVSIFFFAIFLYRNSSIMRRLYHVS